MDFRKFRGEQLEGSFMFTENDMLNHFFFNIYIIINK